MNLVTTSEEADQLAVAPVAKQQKSDVRKRDGTGAPKGQAPALNVKKLLVGSALGQKRRQEVAYLYKAKRFEPLVGKLSHLLEKEPLSVPLLRILAAALSGLSRPGDAAEILELAQQQAPECAETAMDLGQAYFSAGAFAEALRVFWQCVELSPQSPMPLIATARVFIETGQKETASACLIRAAQLPVAESEVTSIAELLAGLQDWQAAAALYERAVQISPAGPENWVRLGAARFEAGQHEDAIAALRKAIEIGADGKAIALLCRMLVALNSPDQATAAAESYLRSHPKDIDARFALGRAQVAALDLVAATSAFEHVLKAAPTSPDALIKMGEMRYYLSDPEGAIAHWEKVIALRPDLAIARWNIASAYLSMGDFDAARVAYREAFAADPDQPSLAKSFVRLLEGAELGALVEMFARTAIAPERSAPERVAAFYGLAEAARLRDDPKLVVSHLEAAAAVFQEHSAISIGAHLQSLANVRAAFASPAPWADQSILAPFTPIFIIGMPRSGTTLMEQIISAHAEVCALGETSALELAIRRAGGLKAPPCQDQIDEIRRGYFAQTQSLATGRPRFVTDKMPMNFSVAGVIAAAFPEAKIIHMTRTPEAVCWSCYMSHFANKKLDYTFEQRALGQYYKLYETHMAFWHAELPGRIIDQSYEALTETPEGASKELFAKINLSWDPSVHRVEQNTRAVRTASVMQVRQPIYRGSSEAWRPYAPWLGPLLEELDRS
ncbi:MAG: sulfotransferase [Pseudomonadota bacterium]